ncbi:MAG: hypothetical protein DMG68_17775 [Acidobacteria bacterium]|nr:MAG: hypothetical protein DMG68_17775 [Acidobacteriota bacterium]
MAMALMAEAKKGISANQVARHLGIQYKTASYLCHRIRKAMEELNATPLGGHGKKLRLTRPALAAENYARALRLAQIEDVDLLLSNAVSRGIELHRQGSARNK